MRSGERATRVEERLPVVEEDLLVVVRRLDEAKVVLQRGHEAVQPLGVGGVAVEDPDGHRTLQAGPLHFVNRELHLQEANRRRVLLAV